MAGTVRHAKGLETRTGRMKLKPGRQAHWRSIIAGRLALGYQRQVPGKAGRWVARSYVAPGKYQVTPLGAADDYAEADGRAVLTFEDACTAVRALHRTADGRATNGTTVADAMADYIAWLRIHRATADDAERRARKLILPALGKVKLSELTSDRIRNWLHRVAERPALLRTGLGA